MQLKTFLINLIDIGGIINKKKACYLLILFMLGILSELITITHMYLGNRYIAQDEFWAPFPLVAIESFVLLLFEIFSIIMMIYLFFRKEDYKLQLLFILNSSIIALFILVIFFRGSILFNDAWNSIFYFISTMLLMLKFLALLYTIILIFQLIKDFRRASVHSERVFR